MTRKVMCLKLGREADGLDFPVWPGEVGQQIFDHISKEAWQMWVQHQTMLLNEYRINPIEAQGRKFIEAEMKKFLFGDGSSLPPMYQPPSRK